eukprot:6458889-Karenia_brevis.AAC.1
MSLDDMYKASGIQGVVDPPPPPPPHSSTRQQRATQPMRAESLRLRPQDTHPGPKSVIGLEEILLEP